MRWRPSHNLPPFDSSKGSFRLSESLPESALQILIKNGLNDLAKDECAVLREARSAAESRIRQERQEVTDKLNEDIKAQRPMLEVALRAELAELISSRFEYVVVSTLILTELMFAFSEFLRMNPSTQTMLHPTSEWRTPRPLI